MLIFYLAFTSFPGDFISNRLQHAQESGYDEVDAVTFLLK
jgi:hypothetical protein